MVYVPLDLVEIADTPDNTAAGFAGQIGCVLGSYPQNGHQLVLVKLPEHEVWFRADVLLMVDQLVLD